MIKKTILTLAPLITALLFITGCQGPGGWKITQDTHRYATRTVSFHDDSSQVMKFGEGLSYRVEGNTVWDLTGQDGLKYAPILNERYEYDSSCTPSSGYYSDFIFIPEGSTETIDLAGKKFEAIALDEENYQIYLGKIGIKSE